MYATSVRAFSRSAVRMNAEHAKSGGAVQWFTYFAGITGFIAVGAGILYKANETNTIKENFQRHNQHYNKPTTSSE